MNIIPISAFTDNYIWLLVQTNNQNALCVDPGDALPVIHYLEKNSLKLDAILLTHHHHDHIGGVGELLEYNPAIKVYGPDDSRIPAVSQFIISPPKIDLATYQFEVLSIPGHTSSHICYYESNFGLLFCGDTLFSAGCGRVFDGSLSSLLKSLKLLNTLPEATRIYSGHEYTRQNLRFAATVEPANSDIQNYYQQLSNKPGSCSLPSTLSLERLINPFLRLEQPEVKHYARLKNCNTDDHLAIFELLREEKNSFI